MVVLIVAFAIYSLRRTSEVRHEIAERRQAEEWFRTLINSSPIGIYVVQGGRFQFINPQFEKQAGYSQEELLGMDALSLVHREDRMMVRENAVKMLKGESSSQYQFRIISKDGQSKWIMETVTSIQYYGKRATLGNFMEITDYKRIEAKLEQTVAELERSNAELERFAYVASHDLQEPLRMVASYVQLLARRYKGKLDDDADDFIGFAVDGATRMKGLINDLLAYSRIGTRGKPFEPTNCGVVLDQVLANLKLAIEESDAVITHEPLPVVLADTSQIAQLLQNLIGNALKFRGDRPAEVHVRAERRNGDWLLSVRDRGIGIAPEFYERIFLVFQRLHNRDEYPGTGIGLAICKKIIERHGGCIWVESEPDKGSVFYFTIPIKGDGQS
ncbi:MAG: PAS domain S-box protein [Chloroflexi bacterium]|nr:PAS domain S-box protein [Chloroflexota bacterium]